MARITAAFKVEELAGQSRGGRQLVRLLEPLTYHVGTENSLETITVPAGFETDFASVPWGVHNLFPPLGPYARPAIIHDWIYAKGGKIPERTYTRKQADKIFLEAMEVVGVSWWKRSLMYRAVRLGGGGGWGREG